MVLESSAGATTTQYASFLTLCGGWARGGRGDGGGDQTSVGATKGGPVVVLGHEGGSSTRAEGSEVERVDKMYVRATNSALVPDLAGDEGGGVEAWGGVRWARGGRWGGHQRAVWATRGALET